MVFVEGVVGLEFDSIKQVDERWGSLFMSLIVPDQDQLVLTPV